MQVLLDGEPCPVEPDNVREAIAAAAALAEERGRLIVEVLVDGRSWSEEDFTDPSAASIDAEEVRLQSSEPADLVRQTIDDAAGALGDADRLQQQCAELLQADRRQEALQSLGEALNIWQAVQDTIVKCSELQNVDPEQIVIDDKPLSDAFAELNNHLLQVRDGLTGDDEVAVADALLYDMPPVVRDWQSLLASLRDRLAPRDASSEAAPGESTRPHGSTDDG